MIVKQMEKDTHTIISYNKREKEYVVITGTEGQIHEAETLIRQKIVSKFDLIFPSVDYLFCLILKISLYLTQNSILSTKKRFV